MNASWGTKFQESRSLNIYSPKNIDISMHAYIGIYEYARGSICSYKGAQMWMVRIIFGIYRGSGCVIPAFFFFL